jgi:hypothetical protein
MDIQIRKLEGGYWKAVYKGEGFFATSEAGALKKLVEAYPETSMDEDNPLCIDCDPQYMPKCNKCLGC